MPQRAYRHDLRCPHCGSNGMPKYGTSRGKQTYRCGDGKHRYTPDGNRHYYSAAVNGQAVSMYPVGSSRSAIGRVLQAPLETVYSWIRKSRSGPDDIRVGSEAVGGGPAGRGSVGISLDEAWTYPVCRKGAGRQELGIWTAVVAEADGR